MIEKEKKWKKREKEEERDLNNKNNSEKIFALTLFLVLSLMSTQIKTDYQHMSFIYVYL